MRPRIAVSYIKELEPQKDKIFESIETWADIDYYDAETEHPEFSSEKFRDTYDLYHMAKTRDQSLEDLKRAEENQVPTVNSYRAAKLADDRYDSIKILEKAGILVPETEMTEYRYSTIGLPAVTKPRFEGGGHIIELLEEPFEGEKLLQELIDYERSIKIYRLGNETRAVELDGKETLGRDYENAVEIEVDRYMEQLSEDISKSSGLTLFEADMVEKNGELYTVDINSMAGLQNIEDASEIYGTLLKQKLGISTEKENAGTSIKDLLEPVPQPIPHRT